MPTATWKPRLRPGSAHCDLQLAVEVRQWPLGFGARGGGPAVRTGIWTARRRRRVRSRRRRRWRRRRRRRTALIKSNNPHLAGGGKKQDAPHKPECSHKEHYCETSYFNSLHFSPVTVPLHCRLWNAEEGGVHSVECKVWSVECTMQSVECKVWSVECKV